ncbi:MAG: hypothetical protein A2X61_03440 [Ignavibacteria bacterium GWB2_35_12]|nr:MAG: hypothetical protein A2X63_10115 [Ignavibacteria bacterium GWA2_35_8]OGU42093.1 MAG: hypothetical protein A2X61_03440 [Ignavibacteria bacterium GWB2_35_12]OGU95575.1 MAG: hypothetical protein A2220_06390 [Ignavibacteria bacterium RIFOXYA2_FULL_35_10]OGV20257.1 MAG: hypothetical protein A2475_07905 [Ignavibacteria bacterium RIFOXYC2_FULL_35_21]
MKDENRIVELLSDLLIEQKNIRKELVESRKDTNLRLDRLEKQQANTNLAIGELRLSFMQLADKFEIVSQHDKRITRLEDSVFHH